MFQGFLKHFLGEVKSHSKIILINLKKSFVRDLTLIHPQNFLFCI